MRIRFSPFRTGLLLAALLLPPCMLAAPAGAARQKELDAVQLRIQALNRALLQDRGKRDALATEIEAAEQQLVISRAEIRRMASALRGREAERALALADRDRAAARLALERAVLAQQLRATFITGQREQARLLLSQESAGPVGRLLTYHDYLNRARGERVSRLHQEEQRLSEAEQRLQQQSAQLAALKAENEKALAENLRLKAARSQLLARLDARIESEEDRLQALQQDEQDLARVLKNIQNELADAPVKRLAPEPESPAARAPPKGRGQMAWPLRGEILAGYGDPKVGGKLSWKGLWIAAERGAPVRASARGRVAFVGFMHRYGLITIIEHESNHFTLYGHLDNITTAAGAAVGPGEVIGQVGDSGGHEQTGLYFEVRRGTEPLDPRDWLQP